MMVNIDDSYYKLKLGKWTRQRQVTLTVYEVS